MTYAKRKKLVFLHGTLLYEYRTLVTKCILRRINCLSISRGSGTYTAITELLIVEKKF